jgi:hypothetical protein
MRSQARGGRSSTFRTVNDVLESDVWPHTGAAPDPMDDRRHRIVAEVLTRIPQKWYALLEGLAGKVAFEWFIPERERHACLQPFSANWHVERHPLKTGTVRVQTVENDGSVAEVRQAVSIGGTQRSRYAAVLYLSPLLERRPSDFAVASVAHELAHLALKHSIEPIDTDEYRQQERDAWALVKRWGFGKEEKAHRTYWERRERARRQR